MVYSKKTVRSECSRKGRQRILQIHEITHCKPWFYIQRCPTTCTPTSICCWVWEGGWQGDWPYKPPFSAIRSRLLWKLLQLLVLSPCLSQEVQGQSAVYKQVGSEAESQFSPKDVFPILHMPVGRNVKDQVFPLLSIPINVEERAGLCDLLLYKHRIGTACARRSSS